jgi:hypothetical protein
MSGGKRLYHVALGGSLATFLLVAPALAQQDVEEPSATINEGQGVPERVLPPENDSGGIAERERAPSADPLPSPPPVEPETDTEQACGPRCEAAEQRANSDLVAQESMADSTKEIVGISEWQLYVGGVGIVFLVLTLVLTAKATNAAVEANRIARKSAERQLRAYVTVEAIQTHPGDDPMAYKVEWKNTGQTPATDVVTYTNWESRIDALPDDFAYPKALINDSAVLGPSQHMNAWTIFIPGQMIQRVRRDILRLFVWGAAEYNDVFEDAPRRRTEFCYEILFDDRGDAPGQVGMGNRICGPHNGMDDSCHQQPE